MVYETPKNMSRVLEWVEMKSWTATLPRATKEIPYYRKLTLHEIEVLEINATKIKVNLMENEFRKNKMNAKEEIEFHNKGN